MACACSKGRRSQNAARGISFVYDFTAPGASEPVTFGTALEAKTELRRIGGGVIRKRQVSTGTAA